MLTNELCEEKRRNDSLIRQLEKAQDTAKSYQADLADRVKACQFKDDHINSLSSRLVVAMDEAKALRQFVRQLQGDLASSQDCQAKQQATIAQRETTIGWHLGSIHTHCDTINLLRSQLESAEKELHETKVICDHRGFEIGRLRDEKNEQAATIANLKRQLEAS